MLLARPLDFGAVPVGIARAGSLVLENVGTGPGAKPEPYPEPEELEPLEIPGKVVLVEDQIRSK